MPAVPGVPVRLIVGIMLLAAPVATAQNPSGVLGPVNALGQEVERPPAPAGPAPRLPDGTIDLGDGIWIGSTGQISQGLPRGESLPLLPAAKALMAGGRFVAAAGFVFAELVEAALAGARLHTRSRRHPARLERRIEIAPFEGTDQRAPLEPH